MPILLRRGRRARAHKPERVAIGRDAIAFMPERTTRCGSRASHKLIVIIECKPQVLPPTTSSQSNHLHRYRTKMDLRKTLLKPFKKLKHRLRGGSRKGDGRSGSESGREGTETDIEGSDASQRGSHLHSEVEDVVESGPNQEGDLSDVKGKKPGQVDSSPFTPPISSGVESSESMQTSTPYLDCSL